MAKVLAAVAVMVFDFVAVNVSLRINILCLENTWNSSRVVNSQIQTTQTTATYNNTKDAQTLGFFSIR